MILRDLWMGKCKNKNKNKELKIAGQALIVIKSAELVGQLNGHDIWKVR